MRRLLLITLVLAMLAPASADADARTPLEARLTGCTTGDSQAARAATFAASMPGIAGTKRMWMRFDLFQRIGLGGWTRVKAPNWGEWERSEPGRPGFIFTKRVEGLRAPAAYRATVRFRWYSAGGRLLRERRRTTESCLQPDPRPNLVVAALTGRAVDPENAEYGVTISNAGYATAPVFEVVLTVGGRRLAPVLVGPLASGTRDLAVFRAPRCPTGDTLTIEVDPRDQVDESDERNAVVERACPF